MKNIFNFKIIILLIAAVIIGIGMSCKSILENAPVELSNQPLLNVLNIQVVDADERTYTTIPDNAIVTLSGKDAAKINSLDGFNQLSIENGFISIGVLRKDTIGLSNMPLEFMITVKANGYVDGRMNYKVATTDAQIATLRMINKDPSRIPVGVVIQEKTFTVGADTTTQAPQTLTASRGGNRTEEAQVVLKQGTKLLDKDGKAVTGTVTATMVSFDASNPESLQSFPGGLNYGNSKDSAGTSTGGGTFTTFGFMALSMSAGGVDVKSFSQPLEVSMELNSSIGRSDSAASPLQAGQDIPVWSLNETNGEWQVEGLAAVTTGANGKLKATFAQTHLSWWNLDDPTCWYLSWWLRNGRPGLFNALGCRSCGNPTMVIRSPNTTGNPNGGSRFYVEILNALANNMVIHSYYDDLVNGANIHFTNYLGGAGTGVNENQLIKFRVYDRQGTGRTLLNPTTQNTVYRPCNTANRIIDLSAMTIPPVPVTINIDFSGLCSGTAANIVIKPTTTFYYKDASLPNSAWLPWGLMRDGVASSSVLQRGKTYYFGVFHSKLNFETTRMGVLVTGAPAGTIKIPATRDGQNIIISLDATTAKNPAWGLTGNIYLKPRVGTDIYDLTDVLTKTNMRRYTFNQYMCDKFKKYF